MTRAPESAAAAVLRMTSELVARGLTPANLDGVCRVAATALGVEGLAVTLSSRTGIRAVIGGSDEVSRRIEAIQLTLGEGPCTEATTTGGAVIASDVLAATETRWPLFVRSLGDLPVRSVFAVPMVVGTVSVGSLDTYASRAGGLGGLDVAEMTALAAAVVVAVLALRGTGTGEGQVAFDVDPAVYQATGMVAAALGSPDDEALDRLRAMAFLDGRLLEDVARDVVEGRLPAALL